MNVLVLANSLSGLISFRKEVIESLLDKNCEVYISVPNDNRKIELEELGCSVIPIEISRRGINPFKDVLLIVRYWKLFRKVKPDIVLGYTIKPNVYGGIIAQILRIPFVANITGLGTAVEYPGILQKVTVTLYKVAARNMKCVFFQNDSNKLFFEKYHIAPKVKKELLPGSGVNLEKFKLEAYPIAATTEFIFISRLMKEKGIEDYLYVAETLKSKYGEKVYFHILGGCEDDKYEQIVHDLQDRGIVLYHGKQKDVRPFIAKTHCTIHPSYYPEGMSNVLLESEAMGHPVITTNRAGCRETVEENVTGFLFNEKDREQLLKLVDMFINLPYEQKKQMGLAARSRVEQLFDRNIVVEKYIKEVFS